MTLVEVATRLGVPRQALSAVLNDRAGVSAEMAVRLSKAPGSSADLWLRLQLQYDSWQVTNKPVPRVRRIAALEMLRRQAHSHTPDAEQRLQRVYKVTQLKKR